MSFSLGELQCFNGAEVSNLGATGIASAVALAADASMEPRYLTSVQHLPIAKTHKTSHASMEPRYLTSVQLLPRSLLIY